MTIFSGKKSILHFAIPFILVLIFFSLSGIGRSFRRAPWYEEIFWNVISPPQILLSATSNGIKSIWVHYFSLVGVQQENDLLKKRVAELELDKNRAGEVEEENKRIRALLEYHDSFPQKTIVARVISNDPRAEFKSITINRGSTDGIEPLMPVIGSKGLVGKVGKVTAYTSHVILITDPNSAVDVVVQRSRARGMIVGSSWHTELRAGYYLTRLEYLRGASDVYEGDVIVTSGLDTVFPPGIPVGTAHDLKMSRYGVFRDANVVPFENMPELQEVMVLISKANISTGLLR